jgi:WD40 repeat protein
MTNGFIEIYDALTAKLKLSSRIINNKDLIRNTILDIIEFKENIFCISCWDFIIRMIIFYDDNTKCKILQKLIGHKGNINSLRKLTFYKNEIIIASSSNDGTVILWKYNSNDCEFNKFKEIKIFMTEPQQYQDFQLESLEESIKYNLLICGQSVIHKVYFCNLNDLSQIEKMNINANRCIKSLKIIDDDFLIVAGNQEIYIIHIYHKIIVSSIKYYVNCEFNCIFVKKNGNILITEYGNVCRIKEFKFDKNKLYLNLVSMRERDFSNYITTIAELDNGDLIAGGYDKTIKIFVKN